MNWQVQRQIEREEEALEKQYNDGELTLKEFNKAMAELQAEYREAAHEAAQEAYNRELNEW